MKQQVAKLKRECKASVTQEKLERKKTGEGTIPEAAMANEQHVISSEVYKDSASFNVIKEGTGREEAILKPSVLLCFRPQS
ncbi:hypothetical protein DPMN_019401 [Dreissena polymorpha]|uniref:Uncharacterized protein n=1 Tax=Dreissena polymorpha TaxID=45954 RepID=A0A9D4NJ70_DREPO|nr:hypothetical protein DPMN_019401 [Dreissena polymorpha]